MKILILDDEIKWRIGYFKKVLGKNHDLTICSEVRPTVKAIKTVKFDLIFLDHDLGTKLTGYEAAKAIPESINRYTNVVIHSTNVPAAERMATVIGCKAYRIPFFTFKLEDHGDTIEIIRC